MKTGFLCVILATLFSVYVSAQSGPAKASIIAANQKFMDTFGKGATGLSDLYARDAELYPPNSNVVKGNMAIEPFWKGAFEAGVKKVSLETISADPFGEVIIETGRYELAGADGSQIDAGEYLVVWKKENGTLKLYRDIWNTSLAAK